MHIMVIWPPAERVWTQQNSFIDITQHKEQEAPWNEDVAAAGRPGGGAGCGLCVE